MASSAMHAPPPDEPTESTSLLNGSHNGDSVSRGSTPPYKDMPSSKARVPDDEESVAGSVTEVISDVNVFRIVSILLIAVFVANADGSIVLATHPVISSEFDAMDDSSWLFTAFGLASCAFQALFGKLSDIFGRKSVLLVSSTVFTVGCCIVGIAQSMFQAILGRVVSGCVSGGMTTLVSILITDLVPIREVGTWRAHINIAATSGRALGGPLGGWLVDLVGWRWSFLGQVPLMVVAIVLCWAFIPSGLGMRKNKAPSTTSGGAIGAAEHSEAGGPDIRSVVVVPPPKSRLTRVDFLGAALMALFIFSILLPIEIGGVKVSWSHPLIPVLFGVGGVLLGLLVLAEAKFAKEPILPMKIFLRRDVVLCFLIMFCMVSAQVGMMFSVPLYFQVASRASNTEAGAHLVPSVVGNAVGGLISASVVRRYGRYKWIVLAATLTSSTSYLLMFLRWHGNTNWAESLYIFPGGFGAGMAQTTVFIGLQAVADPAHLAPAISTLYLFTSAGSIVGVACMSAVTQAALRNSLDGRLLRLGFEAAQRAEIISKAVSNVDYMYEVGGSLSDAIKASYVEGLGYSHLASLGFVCLAFLIALPLRERKL